MGSAIAEAISLKALDAAPRSYLATAPRTSRGGSGQGEPQSYFTVASISIASATSHPRGTGAVYGPMMMSSPAVAIMRPGS